MGNRCEVRNTKPGQEPVFKRHWICPLESCLEGTMGTLGGLFLFPVSELVGISHLFT